MDIKTEFSGIEFGGFFHVENTKNDFIANILVLFVNMHPFTSLTILHPISISIKIFYFFQICTKIFLIQKIDNCK